MAEQVKFHKQDFQHENVIQYVDTVIIKQIVLSSGIL